MRTLGLIPAKGASARLTRKNVRELAGRPLIGWAADAARASGVIDRLIVSTEDAEIAMEARRLAIDVPFMRPAHLARDPAGVVQVALHALDELERAGERFDTLIILLPTCPLRTADDIRGAVERFTERDGKFLLSVAPFDHTPLTALKLGDGDLLEPFFPQYMEMVAKDMPKAYRPNGAIHVLDVAAFRVARSYVAPPLIAYVMPRERSVDIDRAEDLAYAEFLLANGQRNG